MIRSTASHEDDTEQNQTDDGDDFDGREPEFGFSVGARTEEVDGEDENEADCHVDRGWCAGV